MDDASVPSCSCEAEGLVHWKNVRRTMSVTVLAADVIARRSEPGKPKLTGREGPDKDGEEHARWSEPLAKALNAGHWLNLTVLT